MPASKLANDELRDNHHTQNCPVTSLLAKHQLSMLAILLSDSTLLLLVAISINKHDE